MNHPEFIVVWFKRDLRLTDHAAISWAASQGLPVLFLYIHEPSVFGSEHYSLRHERFVWEGVQDIQRTLAKNRGVLWSLHAEVEEVFYQLHSIGRPYWVVSLEEIGMEITYARDRNIKGWFAQRDIRWIELPYSGIRRGLTHRKDFNTYWYGYMSQTIENVDINVLQWWGNSDWEKWALDREFSAPKKVEGIVQEGGATQAWRYLESFVQGRIAVYMQSISKPEASRQGCSRMSVYLAWGHISLREVLQYNMRWAKASAWKRNHVQFASRLRWREHFIQKFESLSSMEFTPINKGYKDWQFSNNPDNIMRWKQGQTGIPLVDASMLSLIKTGYLNFRMRAMLVSFLTHYLNESWQVAGAHLSKQFLDFEPGIHFPQLQMQAGFTGTNTLRIYNPTKQAQDHDPDGTFIKQWIPALGSVPVPLLFEPWLMTEAEQQMYGCKLGEDYPFPVVDLKAAHKSARERLWSWRRREDVKHDSKRVLARLSVPGKRNA